MAGARRLPVVILAGDDEAATAPSGPPSGGLPPAYTRDKILDPELAEVARAFTAWTGERRWSRPAFGRVEVLPPAPTLLPYGIGTYQKQLGCRRF